jgi:multidrug resistance efflux pump
MRARSEGSLKKWGRRHTRSFFLVAAVPSIPHRLQSDLVFQRRENADAVGYVAKLIGSGRFFQLGEVEHFIAQQLDGSVGIEELCRRAEERFGSRLSPETLQRFVDRLGRLGLLETQDAPAPHSARRLQGNLFYLRLKAIDPDRLLDRLVGPLGWLFTPWAVAAGVTIVALALIVLLGSRAQIDAALPALYQFESIVLVWFTLLGVTVVHEFAHGLTCKHFGGQVREMGFMLIYLQPAMYCNVSDAWFFPERSKRLWVTFSGAFVEITIWALAILLWWISDPHSTVNALALLVMATSGVKTLFNLNPLIKLDGYYLLSDWLEIPNLRARAFAYLRSRVSGAERGAAPSSRERRIFLAYSLLAGAFSTWLLFIVSGWLGAWLVGRYQAWGFVALVGVIGMMFSNSLRALGRAARDTLRSPSGRLAAGRRLSRPLLGLLALALLLVLVRLELKVVGEFVVSPAHNHDVRSEVGGIIEAVLVKEGDRVEVGAPLVRLGDRDLRSEREQVAAEIAAQRARHRLLVAGARPEEIAVARSSVGKARERLKYAEGELAREDLLHAQQLASLKKLDQAREAAAVREKELEASESSLRLLVAGSRREEIEAVAAELTRLEARARHVDGQLERVLLVSPIAGVVTTPKLDERIGEYVQRGELVAEVHALETVTVEIAVPERQISDVEVGQRVDLKARAFPGRTFEGAVTAIAPVVTKPELHYAERSVTVTTRLENRDWLLKPQMTGTAKIRCGERRVLELLTRRLAGYLRVEFWSLW